MTKYQPVNSLLSIFTLIFFLILLPDNARCEIHAIPLSGLIDGKPVITAIASAPDSSVWVCSPGHINCIHGGHWVDTGTKTLITPNEIVQSCIVSDSGTAFFALRDRIIINRHNEWSVALTPSELYYGIDTGAVLTIAGNGRLAYGCQGGFSLFNGVAWESFSMSDNLEYRNVTGLTCVDENLWIGKRGGVLYYNGNTVTQIPEFRGESVSACAVDNKGCLVLGIYNKGVSIFDSEKRTDIFDDDFFGENLINALLVDGKNRIWVGTQLGIMRFDNGSAEIIDDSNSLPHNYVLSLAEDTAGDIWIGTVNGLAVYSDE